MQKIHTYYVNIHIHIQLSNLIISKGCLLIEKPQPNLIIPDLNIQLT